MQENKEFIKARDSAFRLLSYRQRSIQEVNQRLKQKGLSAGIIKKTVRYLSELGYLNDEEFAASWIRTKMQLRPAGIYLWRTQLRQKGIAEGIIDKTINNEAAQYDEYAAAKRLAGSRRNRYKALAPQKAKKRLYDYLRRRGFSQDVVFQAIK
jgi:regulatory protein